MIELPRGYFTGEGDFSVEMVSWRYLKNGQKLNVKKQVFSTESREQH